MNISEMAKDSAIFTMECEQETVAGLQMLPLSMTLSDAYARFQGHEVTTDVLDVLYTQLTRDLFAIAKFLLKVSRRTVSRNVADKQN